MSRDNELTDLLKAKGFSHQMDFGGDENGSLCIDDPDAPDGLAAFDRFFKPSETYADDESRCDLSGTSLNVEYQDKTLTADIEMEGDTVVAHWLGIRGPIAEWSVFTVDAQGIDIKELATGYGRETLIRWFNQSAVE